MTRKYDPIGKEMAEIGAARWVLEWHELNEDAPEIDPDPLEDTTSMVEYFDRRDDAIARADEIRDRDYFGSPIIYLERFEDWSGEPSLGSWERETDIEEA